MVGYVQQRHTGGLSDKVNDFVSDHHFMGEDHQLRVSGGSGDMWQESDHERRADIAIKLLHVWVVV
ncbi:hypothetical protein CH254_23710 [Rhodococcus sp. 06-412-2C]|nr:hypothetical protein CH254_23710 [Rhodococcus sp. 06-412-2C]OZC94089.1 hypothetical protein CH279_21795 [Rhodococcus sp. 06-412-2B]